jgi:hypothetical protein
MKKISPSLSFAIFGLVLLTQGTAFAVPTKNLQYVVQYNGSFFLPNAENTVSAAKAKEQRRLVITDVESDRKNPAYLILSLTNREKNKRFKKHWYLGSWQRADLMKKVLLGTEQVTLYDPIHTYSYYELKIGLEGRTDVMPLRRFIQGIEREQIRNHQLRTGDYGGDVLSQIFDWYYKVGVFAR